MWKIEKYMSVFGMAHVLTLQRNKTGKGKKKTGKKGGGNNEKNY